MLVHLCERVDSGIYIRLHNICSNEYSMRVHRWTDSLLCIQWSLLSKTKQSNPDYRLILSLSYHFIITITRSNRKVLTHSQIESKCLLCSNGIKEHFSCLCSQAQNNKQFRHVIAIDKRVTIQNQNSMSILCIWTFAL